MGASDWPPCVACGSVSCMAASGKKTALMVAVALALVRFVFVLCGAFGMLEDADALEALPWATLEAPGQTLYVGINAISLDGNVTKWDDITCENDSTNYCKDCKDAATAIVPTAIISVITTIPQLLGLRARMVADTNFNKFMSVSTTILGTVMTILALAPFADACFSSLPDSLTIGTDTISYDKALGTSFILYVIACVLNIIIAMICLAAPVDSVTGIENMAPGPGL